jgi:hypothetical protein
MSVKLMTTDQIHSNLATLHNMWPGGIPTEQVDQVNALKSELKRRGVDAKIQVPQGFPQPQAQQETPVEGMTADQLAKELGKVSEQLSKNPHDDALQERFANVRFALRQLTKNAPVAVQEVDLSTNNGNGNGHGHVAPNFGQGVPSDQQAQDERVQATHVQRMQDMEQLVRKHNLAKIAAESASNLLRKYDDPNGDDVENACTIGLQIAENIFGKVGL